MRKIVTTFIIILTVTSTFAQSNKKLSTYLDLSHIQTIYDQTRGNNPWGTGLGLQTLINTKGSIKPFIELSGFLYLEDDKVMRLDENENDLPDVRTMVNLTAGASYQMSITMYVSLAGGPAFLNDQTLFAIKPAFGFYFSPSKKWRAQISYINVFNRGATQKQDFGSVSFSVGLKLF